MTSRRYDFFGGNAAAYNARDPEVLVAGPAGTGKSVALLTKCLTVLGKYPGCRGLFLRGTRASLTQSGLVTWEDKVLGPDHPVLLTRPCSRKVRHSYLFPNGSEFVTAGLDDPGKTLSAEYDFVYIQEATEEGVTLDAFETLLRALRNFRVPYQQILMDCNPTTPTHWLYRRQLTGALRLIPTLHRENPAFWDAARGDWTPAGREYVIKGLGRMTGRRRQRFLDGVWAAADGLVYDAFRDAPPLDGHVHPAGWRAPSDWPRVWGVDWGDTAPTVVLSFARDPDGRLHLTRELYQTGLRSDQAGALCRQWWETGEEPRPGAVLADHNVEKCERFADAAGVSVSMADKADRDKGIEQMQARFEMAADGRPRLFLAADARRHDPDPVLASNGKPTCLREELSAYRWNPKAEKDEPVEVDDHACDAARYVCRHEEGRPGEYEYPDLAEAAAGRGWPGG